jgi:hypothetical protein
MDTDKLLSALINLQLWLLLLAAFVLGAIGALAHRASQDPPSEGQPRSGWSRDALVGGVAAVAILYVSSPPTGIALIGGSLVAGYAGKLVLAGLEARVTATIAQREAARNDLTARRARQDLDRLATRITTLSAEPVAQTGGDTVAKVQGYARELQAKHNAA